MHCLPDLDTRKQIREKFNNEVDSEVDCTKFDYLGMVVDTKSGDEAELTMKSYIEEVIKEHNAKGTAATPAADDLFKVDDESEIQSLPLTRLSLRRRRPGDILMG